VQKSTERFGNVTVIGNANLAPEDLASPSHTCGFLIAGHMNDGTLDVQMTLFNSEGAASKLVELATLAFNDKTAKHYGSKVQMLRMNCKLATAMGLAMSSTHRRPAE